MQTGDTYGRLTLVARIATSKAHSEKWLCKCECGKLKLAWSSALLEKETLSCGCWRMMDIPNRVGLALNNPNPLDKDVRKYLRDNYPQIYRTWLRIKNKPTTSKYWRDSVSRFFDDVGDPDSYFLMLKRLDTSKLLGPGNWYWGNHTRYELKPCHE